MYCPGVRQNNGVASATVFCELCTSTEARALSHSSVYFLVLNLDPTFTLADNSKFLAVLKHLRRAKGLSSLHCVVDKCWFRAKPNLPDADRYYMHCPLNILIGEYHFYMGTHYSITHFFNSVHHLGVTHMEVIGEVLKDRDLQKEKFANEKRKETFLRDYEQFKETAMAFIKGR